MNHVHQEAGGPNGGQVNISDSDVRALANDFSGQISFSQFRGGATLTQGQNVTGNITTNGYTDGTSGITAVGSLTKIGATGPNGANAESVYYQRNVITSKSGTTTSHFFVVRLTGNHSATKFTSIFESSLGTKTTSSSTHSYNSGYNYTQWLWTLTSQPTNWDGSGALKIKFA